MSYDADCAKALTVALRDLLNSGLIEELSYANLLKELELGLLTKTDVEMSHVYKNVQAKRRTLSNNVKK